jgi:activating signal cointegrator complex subunit 2
MKADIMRRVEEMDEEERGSEVSDSELGIKGQDYAFEEELDEEERGVVVIGDGDAESGTDEDADTDHEHLVQGKVDPETILELAYIRDPKLFDRDAKTRRDKARADLKEQTGAITFCLLHTRLTYGFKAGETSRSRAGG